jgi:hypothetical protein
MQGQPAFQPDDQYDRRHASDARSRYGVYLSRNTDRFHDGDRQLTASATEFAATAMEIALPPVMAPGYLTVHPLVQEVRPRHDDEGRLAVEVDLVSIIPPALLAVLSERNDHAAPTALPLLALHVPVDADALPNPNYQENEFVDTAKAAVRQLCDQVNVVLAPVLTVLVPGGAS